MSAGSGGIAKRALKQESVEDGLGKVVRRRREHLQLSLRGLAELTGFSPSFMSQVENGQASPSISSLEKIAAALGLTLAEFFRSPGREPPAVVRAEERPSLNSEWSKAKIESLGMAGPGTRLEPVLVTLAPGGMSGKRPVAAATEEFAIVIEGQLHLTLDDQEHALATGDAVTIRAGTPRRWQNPGTTPARVAIVSSRFPF
ncbi:MAG: cupin domain-containing protein [Bryobacteraceae bacterium]